MSHESTICLIASGSPDMRDSLRGMMADYRFLMHETGTGREALSWCGQARPDLIVLDCELPDMDCPALIHALGGLFSDRMPAILACSSKGNLDEISKAMQGGANECIIKPFNADVLDFKLQLIGVVKGQSC